MKGTREPKRGSEFSSRKLAAYGGAAALLVFLLFWEQVLGASVSLHPAAAGIRCLAAVVLLGAGTRMIVEFMDSIPNSSSGVSHIFTASAILLSIIVFSYAILFHELYRLCDGTSFTGEMLTEGDFLYFSVMTITSTGYGDISPRGALAHLAAAAEMLFGFFISSMFLAMLVWKYVQRHRTSGEEREPGGEDRGHAGIGTHRPTKKP
ncbi:MULTISPECIES: potassium channel family protein [Paenibacillus]|uniref:potassium channel family protein n=1 Tax=Paenibacillus TaxID=44249 RepID=UPI0022B91DAE|nr:potassium channel family protein [Paenibacillus caseinilyticus]MCZ8521273.1 potassium channel family protein [Paenibacillus caseinilyticus]